MVELRETLTKKLTRRRLTIAIKGLPTRPSPRLSRSHEINAPLRRPTPHIYQPAD